MREKSTVFRALTFRPVVQKQRIRVTRNASPRRENAERLRIMAVRRVTAVRLSNGKRDTVERRSRVFFP